MNPSSRLRREWSIAFFASLLLGANAALITYLIYEPIYRAESLVEATQDFVVVPTANQFSDLAATEASLVRDGTVLDQVLADPKIRQWVRNESILRNNLTIRSVGSPSRMIIAYDNKDSEIAAEICNAITDAYLRARDASDHSRITNLERWLEPEIQRWEQEVEAKQRKVQKLSEQMLSYSPSTSRAISEPPAALHLLTSLRAQISDLQIKLAIESTKDADESESNEKNAEKEKLRMQLDILQMEYEEERKRLERFGGVSAELQFAQEELSVASEVLRKLRDRVAAIRTERVSTVQRLSTATPPTEPVVSMPKQEMIRNGLIGLLTPYFLLITMIAGRNLRPEETDA
ncbi:MAG: hypothetical protein AAGG48_03175 [Planctomycetota bacterium]